MIARHIVVFTIAFGTLLWAQESRWTPVTREEIWLAVNAELRNRFPGEEVPRLDDIELPAAVSASPDRTLQVSSICWDANLERAQFRLECRPGQCAAFLVHVRIAHAALTSALASRSEAKPDTSCRIQQRPSRPSSHRPLVRSGDHAKVVFLGNRLRLTSAVICLEHGSEGDVIRVRNQDGHIFRARIAGPGLLEVAPQ